MATPPKLTMLNISNQTGITPSLFVQLQQNVQNYGLLFLPLAGGTMQGTIVFANGQQLPASGVAIPNPTYPHANVHQTILDHISDPTIHTQPGPPLAHAASHAVSGSDSVYGDQIGISSGIPGKTVKAYIDATIAAASAGAFSNYPPSSYYEIGGVDPVYGNLTPISAASGSTSIKGYVDNSIAAALAGGFPTSPTFQSITMASTGRIVFSGGATIASSGGNLFSTSGNNLVLQTPGPLGSINLGSSTNPTAFGSFTSGGYTIGSSSLGASGASVNGALVANYDINLTRTATGIPSQAQINFGPATALARLSWNLDSPGNFAFSQGLQIAGPLMLQASNALSIAGELYIGTTANNTIAPGIRTDGTNAFFYAKEGGYLSLGYDNTNLQKIYLGPGGAWAYFDITGFHLGANSIAASGTNLAGSLVLNNATVSASGDLGVARTTSSGLIGFGRSAASIDYGVTGSGLFSLLVGGILASQIRADGTYLTGSSVYGPGSATVNGKVSASYMVAGSGGYTFANSANTGVFSNNINALTLGVSGVNTVNLTSSLATINIPVTVNGNISAASITSSGSTFNGTTTFNGPVLAGGAAIAKFRVKNALPLGYNSGLVSVSSTYQNVVAVNYTGATVDAIRASCLTPDTGATATTLNILKNGAVIGTISLTTGGLTSVNYPIVLPTPFVAGDIFQAVVTAAGTATGLYVVLEISEYIS